MAGNKLLKGHVRASASVLAETDGPPVELYNGDGVSRVVLVCEHAANLVPLGLENLGLTDAQLCSHVAWDPGALDLGLFLSASLNAPLVAARFSRLVYDCNRPPDAPSAMPEVTEVCPIPGNASISAEERKQRTQEIYEPFHAELSRVLALKKSRGITPVLVTIHSFTPVFNGARRYVEIGYLHGADRRLARAMLGNSGFGPPMDVRLNQPYGPQDGVLHTIDRHSDSGCTPHVMIEVRNDLLQSAVGLREVHDLICNALTKSLHDLHLQKSKK